MEAAGAALATCQHVAPAHARNAGNLPAPARAGRLAQLERVTDCIDNRSTDGTADAAQAALEKLDLPARWLLRNRENYGLGGSHKVAIEFARREGYDFLVVLHGDDQGRIQDLVPHLRRGVHRDTDFLLGARFMPDRGSKGIRGWSAFLPVKDGRAGLVQGALFGMATAFLLLMKITYGIAAAGFLGLAVVTGQRRLSTGAAAAAACMLLIALVGAWKGNLGAYVADIRLAILASDESLARRLLQRRQIAWIGLAHGLAVAAILLLGVRTEIRSLDLRAIFLRLWRPVVFCAATLAVGLGLAVQNHPKADAPFFVTAVLLAYLWAAPALSFGRTWWRSGPAVAAIGLVAVAFAYTTGRDLASVVLHRAGATWGSGPGVQEFQGTIFAGLHVSEDLPEAAVRPLPADPADCRRSYHSPAQLLVTLEGLAALDGMAPSATVLALDFFNPFPAARNAAPPTGGMLWYDPGRTIARQHRPAVEDILAPVDVVLTRADCPWGAAEFLWDLLGDEIERQFVPVAETPHWRVYSR